MKKYDIQIDNLRDELLTNFSKATLDDRYLVAKKVENQDGTVSIKKETPQELFERVSVYYGDNKEHAQRIYDYISKMWFMPATPILANGGTNRGLPISCFVNETPDTIDGVIKTTTENGYLSVLGGGIGTYIGNIREKNAKIGVNGEGLGIIPEMKMNEAVTLTSNSQEGYDFDIYDVDVQPYDGINPQMKQLDAATLARTQGVSRRGSSAVYLDISHPEIEEFIEVRRPTGGDPNRKCLNINHAVVIGDDFMQAMQNGSEWELKSPKDGRVVTTVRAIDLWAKILTARIETGEPYILFKDNVNKNKSKVYQALEEKYGQKVKTSNLCNEIMLLTGEDQYGKTKTAVCCLSSLNLEYFYEWKNNELFIEDVARFLDNVLTDFITKAPIQIENARYSASRERSIGIGVMGFHAFLQSKKTPFEGVAAKAWNNTIFKHIKEKCDIANEKLADEKGACPDALELGINHRFANMQAIAPTASISSIANASPSVEPISANTYTHKTLSGSFVVRNKNLKKLLIEKEFDTEEVWRSISLNEGSVQHLDFLSQDEKDVFKTAMEIDQRWVVKHACDRQVFVDQGQSINIFLSADVEKKLLHDVHFLAWKHGANGLYYCRSKSPQRAEKPEDKFSKEQEKAKEVVIPTQPEYDECLACQ